mmetsp:Transcript_27954/g.38647  ORF Transcript_27954/g.38647 Transcript_27954/m.38647 type:complete len:604 (-) Transcript_27954:10-1821(-)
MSFISLFASLLLTSIVNGNQIFQSLDLPRPVVLLQSDSAQASVDHSEFWNVTYFPTYKEVWNTFVGEHYILYQRNTTKPPTSLYPNTTKFFEIPLRSVAVDETVGLTFLELLGLRTTIKYVGSLDFITSGCIRAMVDQGVARTLECSFTGCNATLREMQIADVDALIGGNSPNPNPKSFAFSSTADPGPLHRAEWIEFFALFFNLEYEASVLFDGTVSRYNCHRRAALRQRSNKVVAWISSFNGMYSISRAAYKKQFTEDAGGLFLEPAQDVYQTPDRDTVVDQATFLAALADVDVIIDESYEFDAANTNLQTFCAKYGISPCDITSEFKFMQTRDVWRHDGLKGAATGGTDWFESSIPEPDVVLEDLINTLDSRVNPTHNRTWLWNVHDGEDIVLEPRTCEDFNATRLSRADACSEIVQPPPTDTELVFVLRFVEINFQILPPAFVEDLIREIARAVGVLETDIRIISLQPGSVIIEVAIDFRGNDPFARAFSAFTRKVSVDSTAFFTPEFNSRYGFSFISVPAGGTSGCDTHILDTCGLDSDCKTSDDRCNFLQDETDNWCEGTCYDGDCCTLNGGKVAGFVIGVMMGCLLFIIIWSVLRG